MLLVDDMFQIVLLYLFTKPTFGFSDSQAQSYFTWSKQSRATARASRT